MLAFILAIAAIALALIHFILPTTLDNWKIGRVIQKIPGPPTFPLIGTRALLQTNSYNFLTLFNIFVKVYRPLLRLDLAGKISLTVVEVEDAEVLISGKLHITKSFNYYLLRPWLGDGLLLSNGEKWLHNRKILTPAFHFGILEFFVETFSKQAKILADILHSYGEKPAPINQLMSLCTLDIICETVMGVKVNAQTGGEKAYVEAVLEMSELFQKRQLAPWLYRDFIFNLTPIGRRQKKLLQLLHGFTQKVIKERQSRFQGGDRECDDNGVKRKRAFLDLLIEMSEKDTSLTQEAIQNEVDTFMFEGHDTTSAALSWTLLELSLNPEIQELAFAELQDIFGDSEREPTTSDLAEMKYLERVIKEGLRLYPSVPFVGRTMEEDVVLSGYEVPEGTTVGISIFSIHRDPKLFPDPERFDPDRFLPDKIAKRHTYSYIPFSAGPRNCIGQKFAVMEVKVVLSCILRNFIIKPVTTKKDVIMTADIILRPKGNMQMVFVPRKLS